MGSSIVASSGHTAVASSGHAAIYTRISKDREGREIGVKRQERLCRDKADELGVQVVEVFFDNDISASRKSKKTRPDYDHLLARTRAGEFDMVISYSTSRLTRRPRQFEDWIDLFDERGVVVHTVNTKGGNYDLSTAQGRGDARRRAASDAEESDEISERVKDAAQDRVLRGEWHGGIPPFGYRKHHEKVTEWDSDEEADFERVKKTIVPVPEEVALIEEAMHRVLDLDDTLYGIVKDWNARGLVGRKGAAWKHSVLRNVLVNPALVGINSAGVADCWEPIIDRATHDRLTDRLAPDSARRTNPLGVKSSKYPLGGGLVVCGACEKSLSVVARQGVGSVKMVCRTFMNGPDEVNHPTIDGKSTGRVSIDVPSLEDYLMSRSREHLEDNKFWDAVKRKRETAQTDTARLRGQRDERQGERARAQRAFIAGIMSERDAQAEVARLDAEIDRLTDRIERSHGGPTAQDVWAERREVLDHWNAWAPGERRVFFRALIERVTVGQWPEGIPTTTLPRSGESPEAFKARRDSAAREAMEARVTIDWRE